MVDAVCASEEVAGLDRRSAMAVADPQSIVVTAGDHEVCLAGGFPGGRVLVEFLPGQPGEDDHPGVPFRHFLDPIASSKALGVATLAGIRKVAMQRWRPPATGNDVIELGQARLVEGEPCGVGSEFAGMPNLG